MRWTSSGYGSVAVSRCSLNPNICKGDVRISIISDPPDQHDKKRHLSGNVLMNCGDMFNLCAGKYREIEQIDETLLLSSTRLR